MKTFGRSLVLALAVASASASFVTSASANSHGYSCKRYCSSWGWCGYGYNKYKCCKGWACH